MFYTLLRDNRINDSKSQQYLVQLSAIPYATSVKPSTRVHIVASNGKFFLKGLL